MNDQAIRTELFEELHEVSEMVPEMRAGQLMAVIGDLCLDQHEQTLPEASDVEVLAAVRKFRRDVESALDRRAHPA